MFNIYNVNVSISPIYMLMKIVIYQIFVEKKVIVIYGMYYAPIYFT